MQRQANQKLQDTRHCTGKERTHIAAMIEQKSEGKAPKKLTHSPI